MWMDFGFGRGKNLFLLLKGILVVWIVEIKIFDINFATCFRNLFSGFLSQLNYFMIFFISINLLIYIIYSFLYFYFLVKKIF